jgi:hypothetical protein
MKALVHDGVGIWLVAQRLNQGKSQGRGLNRGTDIELDPERLQPLILGLPWQRMGAGGVITLL